MKLLELWRDIKSEFINLESLKHRLYKEELEVWILAMRPLL